MYQSWIVMIVLLLVAGSSMAQTTFSYANGKRFGVTVTEEALKKAPTWKAEADDPPLAARKAMKIADAAFARLLPEAKKDEFRLEYLILRTGPGNGWYWVAQYRATGGGTGIPSALQVVILMDGSVVEPVVTNVGDR
jgi:hypothetical protein